MGTQPGPRIGGTELVEKVTLHTEYHALCPRHAAHFVHCTMCILRSARGTLCPHAHCILCT